MYVKKSIVLCLSTAVLIGCASTPEVDNSPLIRTAVIKSTIKNGGFKGFLANETQESTSIMEQISRIDQQSKFTGSILGRVSKKQDRSEIVRIDRNLEWSMDNRGKRYRECPLGGCETGSFGFESLLNDDGFESEEANADDSCKITLTENTLTMAPTGESRQVNGFDATEHLLEWTMRGTDGQGKEFVNEISVANWMTPITGPIAEAVAMQTSFNTNYRNSLPEQYPNQVYDLIPEEAMAVMLKYLLEGLEESGERATWDKFANLQVPQGYPVSTKLTWNGKNETCAAPPEPQAEEEKDVLNTGSLRGLLQSVGKQVIKQEVDKKKAEKLREIELRPLLSVLTDVKSIEILDIRESKLTVPSNYKLENRS